MQGSAHSALNAGSEPRVSGCFGVLGFRELRVLGEGLRVCVEAYSCTCHPVAVVPCVFPNALVGPSLEHDIISSMYSISHSCRCQA